MSILERINSSSDIKKLDESELQPLCAEIRDFLLKNMSKTGGHLASNLGTVELTVALHRVYDTASDRIVFDVGHQSYTHKIITGRRDVFPTLRQHGGLSGFPKPYEKNDDAFIAGHASNSVSVALGMARARTLLHENYDVAAVIGDGALTGGLAYEGLINAALSNEPMVIILNDNNMSIDKSVGATEKMLRHMRVKPSYITFKRKYRQIFKKFPHIYAMNHNIKEWLKSWLLSTNIFSEMGLHYLGPVDGHNISQMETVFSWARDLKKPVLVHVLTKKGKGYKFAEEHPETYHGIGSFDIATGEVKASGKSFSDISGDYLCRAAEKDSRITVITAAMAAGTGMENFARLYPDRFFDVGITEGNAVSMASGMAKQGLVPVFAVYSTFLQRGFDMLIHDTAIQNLHVVFCVDRAGLVGNDGETHQGVFDVSFLSSVPGMTVLCPASFRELEEMLHYAIYEVDGPVAVRYPRGSEEKYTDSNIQAETVLREGSDISIPCYGIMTNEALSAAEILSERGISAEIIKLSKIKPADFSTVLSSVRKTGVFLMAEDACAANCVGERILSLAALRGINLKSAKLLNLGEGLVSHGSIKELMKDCGIDAASIANAASELLKG